MIVSVTKRQLIWAAMVLLGVITVTSALIWWMSRPDEVVHLYPDEPSKSHVHRSDGTVVPLNPESEEGSEDGRQEP